MQETRVQSLDQEDFLEEEMAAPSSILTQKSHRGAWWVTGQKVTKSQIQLSDRAHTPDIPIGTEIL